MKGEHSIFDPGVDPLKYNTTWYSCIDGDTFEVSSYAFVFDLVNRFANFTVFSFRRSYIKITHRSQ